MLMIQIWAILTKRCKRSAVCARKTRNISSVGGVMDDKTFTGGGYGARFYGGRAVGSGCVPMKTMEYIRKMGLTVLFAMLSWNAFAAAERFPAVQIQLDEFADAVTLADSPSAVSSPALDAAVVSFGATTQEAIPDHVDETAQSEIVNQTLASLDVVDTAQPPIVPQDAVSLEVVDTGSSRKVQVQQPVTEIVSPGAEDTVALESEVSASAPGEVDELGTDAAPVVGHQARNYEVMVPATDVAEKTEIAGAVVAEAGKISGQPEDALGGAASEEIIHLPYAVLLAILALMSMITVSRRNG